MQPRTVVEIVMPEGGEAGALMRSIDWATTPLGPVEQWPQSLRTTVSIVLGAITPVLVFWGPDLVQIYNDAYRPILGSAKHPRAMGQRFVECFPEIFDELMPLVDIVFAGAATGVTNGRLMLERNGFVEECFFSWAYSPIRDEHGDVIGLYNTCSETTDVVVGERRLAVVRELALRANLDGSVAAVVLATEQVIEASAADLPFGMLYTVVDDAAALVGCAGVAAASACAPDVMHLEEAKWPVFAAAREGRAILVDDVRARFGDVVGAAWPEPVTQAIVVPVSSASAREQTVLVVGLSPRLPVDDGYRAFVDAFARQVLASVAIARRIEQERHALYAAELEQRRLEEDARSRDEFLAMLGHELRNPLAPVLNAVHLARHHNGVPVAVAPHLEMIERQATNLTRIVDDLLDVSRLTRGLVTLHQQVIDLGVVARAAAASVAALVDKKRHTLTVKAADPVYVVGDPVRLEQVLVNLLNNAAKYTDDGGRISVEVDIDDHGAARVRVVDNGIGLDEALVPRIFELFRQAERSLDRSLGGLGIGLTVVRRLVEMHGGVVVARSAGRDAGTTIEMTLPLAPPPTTSTTSTSTPALPPPAQEGPLRVLVVDDNVDAAEALADLLDMWGHTAQIENTGTAALTRAATMAVDAVILDIGLPDVDGYEVARRLRAIPAFEAVRIVALTGYGQAGDRARSAAAGFDEHLVKPVSPSALEGVLARVKARLAG